MRVFIISAMSIMLGLAGLSLAQEFTSTSDDYRVTGTVKKLQRRYPTVSVSQAAVPSFEASLKNAPTNPNYEKLLIAAISKINPGNAGLVIFLILSAGALAFYARYTIVNLRRKLEGELREKDRLIAELAMHRTFDDLRTKLQEHLAKAEQFERVELMAALSNAEEFLQKTVKEIIK